MLKALNNSENAIEEIRMTWSHIGLIIMFDDPFDNFNIIFINTLINNLYDIIFLKSIETSDKFKNVGHIFLNCLMKL